MTLQDLCGNEVRNCEFLVVGNGVYLPGVCQSKIGFTILQLGIGQNREKLRVRRVRGQGPRQKRLCLFIFFGVIEHVAHVQVGYSEIVVGGSVLWIENSSALEVLLGLLPLLLVEVLSALIKFFLCLFGNIQFSAGNGALLWRRLRILRFGFDEDKFRMIGAGNGNDTACSCNDPAARNPDYVVSWFQIQENNWTETIGRLGCDKAS